MEFNLDIRKKQLQSLKQYVRSSEDNVKAVFQSLGWTPQKTIEKDDIKMICPINKSHLVSQKTFDVHLKLCTLKSSGYKDNELFLSEPPDKSEYNIKIPNPKKMEILGAARGNKSDFKAAWNGRDLDPHTSDRLTSTFSVDERLALYDYSIKHTTAPPKPEEFTLDLSDPKEKKGLTSKEILALERDVKRRRAKYKSVHTSKKSQTEITREVIDNQMTLYTEWIKQKQEREKKEKEKMARLAKDKMKTKTTNEESQQNDNQYYYIGTTYDQNIFNPNTVQWNQTLPYSSTSNNSQYYNSVEPNQDVITDWSHLYQGGIDTEFYTNSGQCQAEAEGAYVEPNSSIDPTHVAYANNLEPSASNTTTNSLYKRQATAEAEQNHKIRIRFKATPEEEYQNETRKRLKSKTEEENRYEKLRKSRRSR